jgi:hypothetical protein
MRTRRVTLAFALLILGGASRRAAAGDAPAPKKAVDPLAVAALGHMGAFLRAQNSFAITADTLTDEVLDTGQKVKRAGTIHMEVRRPDGMRAEVRSEGDAKRFFYDGKTFTVFSPATGYYASFAAPPTLREVVDLAERRYGIDMPLADLFQWGHDRTEIGRLTSATALGRSQVRGVACDQFAFREPEVDWQLWIEQGARPLPRRLVITTKAGPQPEHDVVYTWDLGKSFDPRMFAFEPPPAAHRIEFQVPGGGSGPLPLRRGLRPPTSKGGTP